MRALASLLAAVSLLFLADSCVSEADVEAARASADADTLVGLVCRLALTALGLLFAQHF